MIDDSQVFFIPHVRNSTSADMLLKLLEKDCALNLLDEIKVDVLLGENVWL